MSKHCKSSTPISPIIRAKIPTMTYQTPVTSSPTLFHVLLCSNLWLLHPSAVPPTLQAWFYFKAFLHQPFSLWNVVFLKHLQEPPQHLLFKSCSNVFSLPQRQVKSYWINKTLDFEFIYFIAVRPFYFIIILIFLLLFF
jgi:hypothetical protein